MKQFVLITLLSLLVSLSVGADKFSELTILAEKGDPSSQYQLANMYRTGEGVAKNSEEAVKWFHKSAEQGWPGWADIGVMYESGDGVSPNYRDAVRYFRKSAMQGYDDGQMYLGGMYNEGKGVPENFAEAYVWFSLAAIVGSDEAIKMRDLTARKLSPDVLDRSQQRAAKLFEEIKHWQAKNP